MDKKNRNKQIVISFTGFLAGAAMLSLMMPQKGFSTAENRYLKKRPEFTRSGLLDGSFGRDYETYLSDQFPARDAWIGMKVMVERAQGRQDVNGVYFGKEDYLIEKFETEEIEGELLYHNLNQVASFVLNAQNQFGNDRVRVMLVPAASQILTDKLPFLAAPYDQSQVTDQLAGGQTGGHEETGEAVTLPGIHNLVVPVEALLKEHRQEDLYYKTDHHWTALGAYYGYRAWAESVGIVPWERDAFEIQTVSEEFLGTVYSKVNLPHRPDSIELYLPETGLDYEIYYDGAEEAAPMYSYQALEGKDKYGVYLGGNHGLVEIRNPNGTGKSFADRKLLIIKDSFANSFAPFVVNHFGVTYMIDLRYFNQSPQTFMEEKGITEVLVLYQIPGFAKEKTVGKLNR